MDQNWTSPVYCLSFLLLLGTGLGEEPMPRQPLGPIVYNERMNHLSTPFSNTIQDFEYLLMPTSTSRTKRMCEKDCPATQRIRRSTSRKAISDDLPMSTGNSQVIFPSFPTLDPPREKNNKNQKNKKGNRSQKFNGMKENNAMLNGGDSTKGHSLNSGSEKRGKKKSQSKKGQTPPMREGQSPRRLRQHMQHKKKVKQFLQKRIQEQIEKRSQNTASKY